MNQEPSFAMTGATASAPSRRVAVETSGLTKRFGDILAVAGLKLQVFEGEVFGLLGPNGAGKSTTINLICGLLAADGGSVRIFGQAVRPGAEVVRSRVGICPQEIVVWPKLTCLEQLEFTGRMYGLPRSAARTRGASLLEALGLAEKRNRLAATLSGGMKRRLNLALALVHDPAVVILDEPEAGLDPQSRVMVREYIRAMAARRTVLFTTHNMDEAERICDRVAVIDRGRLLALDTPGRLKKTIGAGGVLEIVLDGPAQPALLAELEGLGLKAVAADRTLVVRGADVVSCLPVVLDRLRTSGAVPGEVRLRENSLEDVFIALTGRRLRE
ncbi:MAG: ABC transporter ATP-binding protein [Acidobacteriota bacterium]|nr:ABC transporter ATP-binding protein [Acidobacteriota bacterium]